MATQKTNITVGSSFLNLLGVAFIVLKIVGVEPIAQWKWLWVLSPFWIPIAFFLLLVVLWGIITLLLSGGNR